MHKRITFRNMESSDFLERYANEQLEKIITFLEHEREPVYIDLIMESGRHHAKHNVELRVKSPNYDKISNYEGPDFNDVLDRVIDVMYNELCEAKRERIDKRNHPKGKTRP